MRVLTIIPARMAASRFPGKPMAKILGFPMIGHCYIRARMARLATHTYVATCDTEIHDFVRSIGGNAVMTSTSHERATDRTAEATARIEQELGITFDLVAMLQGDEPLVRPEMIDEALAEMASHPSIDILNLMARIVDPRRFDDPNEVKVVTDLQRNALYFSREPIPSTRKYQGSVPMQKQLGVIFFRRTFLDTYAALSPTPLEIIESVDMNRVLEHGYSIRMKSIDFPTIGVDVPADLSRAEALMKQDNLLELYQHA